MFTHRMHETKSEAASSLIIRQDYLLPKFEAFLQALGESAQEWPALCNGLSIVMMCLQMLGREEEFLLSLQSIVALTDSDIKKLAEVKLKSKEVKKSSKDAEEISHLDR